MSDQPEVADLTIRVLQETRDEVKQANARLDQGFAALRSEMRQGCDLLGRRIDNLFVGEHRHEHEELRVRGLEPR